MGAAQPQAAPTALFESAKAASDQRAAKSVAAADMSVGYDSIGGAREMKRAGAKMFTKDGDRWIDALVKPGLQVYKVKAYSRSYFTLLEKLQDLREPFALGGKVLVSGKAIAIEVVDDAPELTDAQLSAVVKGW